MTDNGLQENGDAIIALVKDLMFASRIRGAAEDARTVMSADALEEAVGPGTRLVLVDLQVPDAPHAIRRLTESEHSPKVVAFGSHVDTQALAAARAAGADTVMPRSEFVRELGRLIAEAEA